jgi:Fe(3+) dicitrate transport protein
MPIAKDTRGTRRGSSLPSLLGIAGALLPCAVASAAGPEEAPAPALREVVVEAARRRDTIGRLPDIQGTAIYAGKKSEVIEVAGLDANLAEKNPRQIFSKVPGVFVYDMDGAGNQVNIATRGLDPHRGWEFNNRKDGFITNSDMYGYPASHFSVPMEAVQRVELVRGTGSLQYGAQFGGMLNYVTKAAEVRDGLAFESINSAGSYGLLSTYNGFSAGNGRSGVYADYTRRESDGYRRNGSTEAEYYSVSVRHEFSPALRVEAGYGRSKYVYRLPGPLTDAMFAADPRQSTRSRNYYSPDIEIPSVGLEWTPSEATTVSLKSSVVLGNRSSVLFDRTAEVPDAVLAATGQQANRQVDIDDYQSRTNTLRVLHRFTWRGREHALAAGVETMDNDTRRRQQGVGTTGSDFDLALVRPGWGRDLRLDSTNVAGFVEQSFSLSDRWRLNAGARVESGRSNMTGLVVGYAPGELPNTIRHEFTLLGLSTEYRVAGGQLYAGYSQAYRPVIFKDIIPSSPLERVDKNLKNARGYTLELGWRGETAMLAWDVSAFELQYANRMGTIAQSDAGGFFNLRTNIGDSRTRGLEVFVQHQRELGPVRATLFTSTSWMDARYQRATARVGQANLAVDGNRVQSVPELISRSGLTLSGGPASLTLLYSYTAESYADALNTRTPSANGAVGLVPSSGVVDLTGSWRFNDHLGLSVSVNNLADRRYFTKRPEFYPGPGVWPSDGRSVVASLRLSL